jgi:hypothetical protein
MSRGEGSRKLLTIVGRCTHHLVTPSNLSANAAKNWATRGRLIECHVCIGKALLDHVHDFGHNIADLRVLERWSVLLLRDKYGATYVGVDACQHGIEPGKSLWCVPLEVCRDNGTSGKRKQGADVLDISRVTANEQLIKEVSSTWRLQPLHSSLLEVAVIHQAGEMLDLQLLGCLLLDWGTGSRRGARWRLWCWLLKRLL